MSNTASAAVKPAKVTIAHADNAGDRQIFRNGVLVGSCYQARMSWGGASLDRAVAGLTVRHGKAAAQ